MSRFDRVQVDDDLGAVVDFRSVAGNHFRVRPCSSRMLRMS